MAERPNILLIMSDQHNPHILGCAGDDVIRTPHLDALARGGTRFTSAYTPSPLCVPGRMSFLTSRYPCDQHVWSNSCVLPFNVPTFAHSLGAAGYQTALCGRMHLIGPDTHGFEKRLVGDVTPHLPGTGKRILEPIPNSTTGQTRPAVEIAGPGQTAYQAFDEAVVSGARKFLQSRDAARPFCLVAGLMLPHCPFIAPKDLYDAYYSKVKLPRMPEGYYEHVHPFIREWRRIRRVEDLSADESRRALAAYYALIDFMDARIGELLNTLADLHLLDNTVVIYTSDHGDMAGEHGMWWKSNFYEGSAGVPLLVSWPGQFAAGRTVPQVSSLLDIGPTLLDLAQATPLPRARGRSLLRFLQPEGPSVGDWPNETISEYCGLLGEHPARMLRSGPWKLCHYHGYDTPQLFNLEEDPGEWHDRAGDPACRAIRDTLHAKVLDGWDGAAIERELKEQDDAVTLLVQWGRAVQPSSPLDWQPPPGANVF